MDWVFWVIVAGIVAACAVAYVAVRFGRSNKQVTAAPEAKAVTPTTVEQEPA
ncbi:signal recognition particle-docking protein FtsY, partial [Propionibacterium freudenreichii]|nr:signal recognition particle-docking protein FtsY [Propionibacterium freudenreichii]